MIAIGLGALLMATLENRRDLKILKADYPTVHFSRSLARVFRCAGLNFGDSGIDRGQLAEITRRIQEGLLESSLQLVNFSRAVRESLPGPER